MNKKRKPGRPITRRLDPVHATADELVRAMFASAKPPDPGKRPARRLLSRRPIADD
ncbi:MAG: hypothetical protein OXG37_12945 [Actinomycetia bacterium]|nr:hypothetical protein [Actinomycetes bacterium]